MANREPVRGFADLLDRLAEAWSAVPDDDEVREELREAGVDPDLVVSKVGATMEEARRHVRADRFAAAAADRAAAIEGIRSESATRRTRADRIAHAKDLVERAGAEAQFRDFDAASDADLDQMIAELEYLLRRGEREKS